MAQQEMGGGGVLLQATPRCSIKIQCNRLGNISISEHNRTFCVLPIWQAVQSIHGPQALGPPYDNRQTQPAAQEDGV